MSKRTQMVEQNVEILMEEVFGESLHARRIESLKNATLGVMQSASLAIQTIGHGLATCQGLVPKHAIKQVDRLLSNRGIALSDIFPLWVSYIVAERQEIVVALDWTEFDDDEQSTLCLYLVTTHGRATPLLWKTVYKKTLKGHRSRIEERLLKMLRKIIPSSVHVVVLADRGFGGQGTYECIGSQLGFDFIIRFRQDVTVTSADGISKTAGQWVPKYGRATLLLAAQVTKQKFGLPAVVCVKQKKMKEAWCLATTLAEFSAAEIIALYGRRFTIEESFRDAKDIHFGMGLVHTRIGSKDRRDRLLLVCALAIVLLTLLGSASENLGMDKLLRANTVKRRTHSLLRQGLYWYHALPNLQEGRRKPLLHEFSQLLVSIPLFKNIFGPI